jgi:hypothetical protein
MPMSTCATESSSPVPNTVSMPLSTHATEPSSTFVDTCSVASLTKQLSISEDPELSVPSFQPYAHFSHMSTVMES